MRTEFEDWRDERERVARGAKRWRPGDTATAVVVTIIAASVIALVLARAAGRL